MTELVGWFEDHETLFQILGAVSLTMLLVSLVVFPLVVAQLPTDYFIRERRRPARLRRRHPVLWAAVTVVKNAVGLVLIAAGLAMLVLPGQGLLTILIGLALTNFPGKFRLERRLFGRPPVHRALNRVRRWAGKAELEGPPADD